MDEQVPERRRKRREARREMNEKDIVDTAEAMFLRSSYENVSMDHISTRAEFTKRTLYSYFPTKRILFLRVVERAFVRFNEVLKELFETGNPGNGLEGIRLMGEGSKIFASQHPDQFRLIVEFDLHADEFEESKRQDEFFSITEEPMRLLLALLEEGKKAGVIRKEIDTVSSAVYIWTSFWGMLRIMLTKADYFRNIYDLSLNAVIDTAMDFLERSLRT